MKQLSHDLLKGDLLIAHVHFQLFYFGTPLVALHDSQFKNSLFILYILYTGPICSPSVQPLSLNCLFACLISCNKQIHVIKPVGSLFWVYIIRITSSSLWLCLLVLFFLALFLTDLLNRAPKLKISHLSASNEALLIQQGTHFTSCNFFIIKITHYLVL